MAFVTFDQPVFLWLVIILPLLFYAHFFFLGRTQKKALRFANFETIKRIANERFVTKNITVLILRFLVFAMIILALAGTTYNYDGLRNDFDYVVAIDTSSSMLTSDIAPNRFVAAKEGALIFLNELDTNAKVGLVSFSGVTYARHQLKEDKSLLRLSIATLNISRISGTDIGGAIVTGSNMFIDEDRGKAIILLTDGVSTVGSYIDDSIVQAARYAKNNNIVIHAVGFGTSEGVPGFLPESFNLTTGLDTESLEYLANETGGSFLFPEDEEELNEYFATFDDQASIAPIALDLKGYLFIGVFTLLVIEWILINLFFRRVI